MTNPSCCKAVFEMCHPARCRWVHLASLLQAEQILLRVLQPQHGVGGSAALRLLLAAKLARAAASFCCCSSAWLAARPGAPAPRLPVLAPVSSMPSWAASAFTWCAGAFISSCTWAGVSPAKAHPFMPVTWLLTMA